MPELNFTPEQELAVSSRGEALLVSAAAGSGKTRVLVERVVRRVCSETSPCDIDRFLIITYTNAAAAELRSRILQELSRRLAREPGNRHLRRQTALCHQAQISTIHGFCVKLLRENAPLLGLSPEFRVAEEAESQLLRARGLERCLEKQYETSPENSPFFRVVDALGAGRDDKKLSEMILDAYSKLISHVDPAAWAEKLKYEYTCSGTDDAGSTPWGSIVLHSAADMAAYWKRRLDELLLYGESDFVAAYGPSLEATLTHIDRFLDAADSGWDSARAALPIAFPRAKAVKGCDASKAVRKAASAELTKLSQTFAMSSAELLGSMEATGDLVAELYRLVLEFMDEYTAEKRRLQIIDFSDQEHLALKLLCRDDGKPTAIAAAVADRYEEILVDEYQDVNAVQELLFTSVSRGGKNLFMVGDVKQSIYRFRLADPGIFLDKYERFTSAGGQDAPGKCVVLSNNFRSRSGVLDAVNELFYSVMSKSMGELDYTEREALYAGLPYAPTEEPCAELDIIDLASADEDEDAPGALEAEAEHIARRIQQLLRAPMQVGAPGQERDIRPGDIAILMRAPGDRQDAFISALRRHNIPVAAGQAGSFYDAEEVLALFAVLSVIDNPRQDIPLLTAMRSVMWDVPDDLLALMRAENRSAGLYDALVASAPRYPRLRAFLDDITAYRKDAPELTAQALLRRVCTEKHAYALYGARPDGHRRTANIDLLSRLAAQSDDTHGGGVFTFVRAFARMAEQKTKLPEQDGSVDAVRIMSVHKSKGLEFPVVFLARTAARFNEMDLNKPLLVHSGLGVGINCTDRGTRVEYPTLARLGIRQKLRQELRSEELRVLYVALTRAREKLIITGVLTSAAKTLESLRAEASAPLPPELLLKKTSFLQWLLLSYLSRPREKTHWNLSLYPPQTAAEETEDNSRPAADEALVTRIRDISAYAYPHAGAENVPSKLTATGLKGRAADLEAASDAQSMVVERSYKPFRKPDFAGGEVSAVQRGTATHLMLQHLQLGENAPSVPDQLRLAEESGKLTHAEALAVDADAVCRFAASPLAARIANADHIFREFKFSVLVPAGKLMPGAGEDEVLLQGVTDCCIREGDSLTVIDFKTDRVRGLDLLERGESYRAQLEAYSLAMELVTGLPVRQKLLVFLDPGEILELS